MKDKLFRFFIPLLLWFGRHFLGWGKLKILEPILLNSRIEDVRIQYGHPLEVEVGEFNGASSYTFSLSPFHEAVLTVVDGQILSVTYWSAHADPKSDLETVLDWYSDGYDWDCVEEGYWFFRSDDEVRLWCSAAPAIGVGTKQYFKFNVKK